MKIVVLSDTHMPKRTEKLPELFINECRDAGMIIHAGDWQSAGVLNHLIKLAPVKGVYGNADGEDIKQLFPRKQIIHVNGVSIGIIHGHGKGKTTEKRAYEAFEEKPDCIIFGHSHIPYLRHQGSTLMFNPGSLSDKRKLPKYSYGVLTLADHIRAEFVFFE